MRLNLIIASLFVVIGVFGFSSTVLAQTNKKTTNKAQAKTGATAATPKKTKNPNTGEVATPKRGNTRPPSTGTGNGNNRPASTGESLNNIQKLVRQLIIFRDGVTIPSTATEDSGSNLARTKGFIDQAEAKSAAFYNTVNDFYNPRSSVGAYINPPSDDWYYNYNPTIPENMNELKNNLQKALNDLNAIQFETGENHRLSAIDLTERAIRQIDAYLVSPPAPTRKSPTGTKAAKGRATSQNTESQQMTNPNGVDTTLKTAPAGSTEKTTPAKTTNAKPKAAGKVKKPTNNLSVGDDPFGKTPPKTKTKGGN